MLIRFWPHTTNQNVASYRLRCLNIVRKLGKRGLNVDIYREGDKPEILVLSKRYDSASLNKALKLKEDHGTVICLDLCDNHFYYSVPDTDAIDRANTLRQAIKLVDRIFVSSHYLADLVQEENGEGRPVSVVGDIVEEAQEYTSLDIIKHPVDYIRLKILDVLIAKHLIKKSHRLIWFGHHGSNFTDGGMRDLKAVLPILEALNQKHKICLTVISNSKKTYTDTFAKSSLNTFYIPWSRPFFSAALKIQGISIIPIQKNPFTMAKTSNRVATSLVHDLKVVADIIPSYEEYKQIIASGDWLENLTQLLTEGNVPSYVFNLESKNNAVVNTWQKLFDDLAKSEADIHA
ncbi:MAG: hypothetical protein ACI9CE_001620 [Flavobacterium sp.]|jgi:hypothetical protein